MDQLLNREISKKLDNSKKIEKNYKENRLVDDEIVIELVKNQLIKYEEENCSYIIQGFPRNRNQAIFLQSIGLLPDNIIVLKTSREKSEESIMEKLKERFSPENKEDQPQEHSAESESNANGHKSDEQLKEMAKISMEESEMNISAVEDVFSGFYCEIPVDKYSDEDEIVNELANLLKFKNKTNAARKPPRIVLTTPPATDKNGIAKNICNELKIIHVNVIDLLKKEIAKKNENSKIILSYLEKNDLVDDKFLLKLIEERLFSSDCMINGWILTGFPRSESQINFMEKMTPEIKPSLIAVVDMEQKNIIDKAKKIKYDPKTGKIYLEKEENKYESITEPEKEVSNDVIKRLIGRKQDEDEILKKRSDIWRNVCDILLQKESKNILKLNGDENDEKKLAQLIIDAVKYNS
jgi:adenylate kinase